MLGLTEDQRVLLADKLGDAANLVGGALVLGQFISGSHYSVPLALAGLGAYAVLLAIAVALEAR
jgi:hypothetical protein